MEANNPPLVSVPVVTYNSAKYVLETLESIKAQTYQNIELIISDDCSTDNTIELCKKWIGQNKERFVRTQIITSNVNTGVSANLNRAETACKGEWVKGIAGDDILVSNCIRLCVDYVIEHPNVYFLFGKVRAFGGNEEQNELFTKYTFDYSFFDLSTEKQLNYLLYNKNCIPASTFFYNKQKLTELKIYNDERIPLLEDWPRWIKILETGFKLHCLKEVIVRYRLHSSSLSTNRLLSVKYFHSNILFDLLYRYPHWLQKNNEDAIKSFSEYYTQMYATLYEELVCNKQILDEIKKSVAYKISKKIARIINIFRK